MHFPVRLEISFCSVANYSQALCLMLGTRPQGEGSFRQVTLEASVYQEADWLSGMYCC